METLVISNHKGGVGKTALVMNLGAMLSMDFKVLLVDCDSQVSLSSGFRARFTRSLTDVINGDPAKSALIRINDNLDLLPADLSLSSVELSLVARLGRENILKKALSGLNYDLCIIDTAGLGLLSINALVAADGIIIPVKAEGSDLKMLMNFNQTLEQIKAELNPGLEIIGTVIMFFDGRLLHHQAGIKALKNAGYNILGKVGRTIKFSESYTAGKTLIEYAPENRNVKELLSISKVVKRWVKNKR